MMPVWADSPCYGLGWYSLRWLHQKTGLRCLFVLDTVGAYERKRLIEDKIPFLAPGQQLYLPDLGLDLREQFRTPRREHLKISPAAQLVVLACLLRRMDTIKADGTTEATVIHIPRGPTASSTASASAKSSARTWMHFPAARARW